MNRTPTIGLSLLMGLLLAGAVPSPPPRAIGANAGQDREARQARGMQSLSGRITSIQGNTFTVESERSPQTQNARTDPTSSMTFMLDQNTTVDGKLEIGANADVTFRQENGNNIAVSVRITARA